MNFYGSDYDNLKNISNLVFEDLNKISGVLNVTSRIKSSNSVIEKLYRKNKIVSLESAYNNLTDIIGLRTVVRIPGEVYNILDYIKNNYVVTEVKDYIKEPKETGYQSLHVIINVENMPVEVQIRTVSQDVWANYEHKNNYKKTKFLVLN